MLALRRTTSARHLVLGTRQTAASPFPVLSQPSWYCSLGLMVVEIDFWLVSKVPASHCIKLKHEEYFFLSMASGLKQHHIPVTAGVQRNTP